MCEQNRSYTPGKSFVQILLLPAPFRAFISSPQVLAGQAASRSKIENVGKHLFWKEQKTPAASPCWIQALELGGLCIWPDLIIPLFL